MKNVLRRTISITVFLLYMMIPAISMAQKSIIGTYLTTVTLKGEFSSRSILTLHSDFTMSVVDSMQGNDSLSFSGQQGIWKKVFFNHVIGRTIDFNFKPTNGIARCDYDLTINTQKGTLRGTLELRSYDINGDPNHDEGDLIGVFNISGEQLNNWK